jgi:hypothetical protein
MNCEVRIEKLQDRVFEIRGQVVLLDADIAGLYGVKTKRINEAVRNNPEKFPVGYIIQLEKSEWELLRSKISTAKSAMNRALPKAFTEKGLYMLATILKSPQAVDATLGIIETFSKIRELSRNIRDLSAASDGVARKDLLQKSGTLISEVFDEDLRASATETSIELNFAVLKFRHTVKRKR